MDWSNEEAWIGNDDEIRASIWSRAEGDSRVYKGRLCIGLMVYAETGEYGSIEEARKALVESLDELAETVTDLSLDVWE